LSASYGPFSSLKGNLKRMMLNRGLYEDAGNPLGLSHHRLEVLPHLEGFLNESDLISPSNLT